MFTLFKVVWKQTVDSNARQSCKVPKESLMAAIRNFEIANRSFETFSGESKSLKRDLTGIECDLIDVT